MGVIGAFFNSWSFLHILFNIEIILLSVSLNYLGFSIFLFDIKGQIYALVILIIAAAESCVGLALVVSLLRINKTLDLNLMNNQFLY